MLSCSMPATGPFAGTDAFKTLAKEVADFYGHYVEAGKKKPMRGFDVFEKWMKNIKTSIYKNNFHFSPITMKELFKSIPETNTFLYFCFI